MQVYIENIFEKNNKLYNTGLKVCKIFCLQIRLYLSSYAVNRAAKLFNKLKSKCIAFVTCISEI